MRAIRIYAPATTANMSVGFDILGAALAPVDEYRLGDWLTLTERNPEMPALTASGPFAEMLPEADGDNLVLHAARLFADQVSTARAAPQKLAFHLEKGVPVGSGMGSSAASAVAALLALNHYYNQPLSPAKLVLLAGELEGSVSGSPHYDNVAPALLGGLQLMTASEHEPCQRLPFFEHWRFVLIYPGFTLSTRDARAVLPERVPLQTAIQFGRNLGCFVHAVHAGDEALAALVLQDVLAEPFRRRLVAGFDGAHRAAHAAGAMACGLSGAGPSLFALVDDHATAIRVKAAMLEHYADRSNAFGTICCLDDQGARLL